VKAEQTSDKFCNSIEVGKFLRNLEYFYDEERVIQEANERRTPVVGPQDIGKGSDPGRKRTLEILCIRYYWPKMRQDVEDCQGM
jgi:hypothetical protein